MFSGRSSVGSQSLSPESPKTPRLPLGLNNLSSTRLAIPHASRLATTSSPHSLHPSSRSSTETEILTSFQPTAPEPVHQHRAYNGISVLSVQTRHQTGRRFVDPAEQQLAELANEGRRRRPKTHNVERRRSSRVKKPRLRSKILTCFISGVVLLAILAIYLGLVLSPRDVTQEFRVLLILILLVAGVIFCHSLIRLVLAILSPPKQRDLELHLPQMASAGGYANPSTPIRVALARDEEAMGVQSEATKHPPPAYGLWRESVRVDPNRIFWQRNETAQERPNSRTDRPQTANRPPSYISEDGVHYVLEAQPRSIAPAEDIPLPPHPAERTLWPLA